MKCPFTKLLWYQSKGVFIVRVFCREIEEEIVKEARLLVSSE